MQTVFLFNIRFLKKNSVVYGFEYKEEVFCSRPEEKNKLPAKKKIFSGEIEVCLDRFSNFVPSGFLPLLLKFATKTGYFSPFEKHLSFPMKSVCYTPFQKLQVLISSILVNCSCTRDINHKLKPYPEVARLLGIQNIPDQSTINRFLNRFDVNDVVDLETIFDVLLQELFLPEKKKRTLIVDATGLVVFGDTFQFARKGYFANKRGNKGYQVSLGITAEKYPKITSFFLDPGNIYLDMRLWDTIYQTAYILGGLQYIGLVIADAIYGIGKHITTLIDMEIPFLIKGKNCKTAFHLADNLTHDNYYYINSTTEVAEYGSIPIRSCPHNVRTVIIKKIDAKGKTIFNRLLTSISKNEADCVELFSLYNQRQLIESEIKGNKNGLSVTSLRTSKFWGIYAFLYCAFSTFNLFSLFKEKVLVDTGLENLGLTEITDKLMDIPGKIQQQKEITKLFLPLYHNYSKAFVQSDSSHAWDTS